MRLVGFALAFWAATAIASSEAADCAVSGPLPKLDSQPVEWKLAIASGQSCVRGLRSMAMTLESVKISEPAKLGEATTQGYSFTYRAPRESKGDDSFAVTMVGTNRGARGNSVIVVRVSVR